MGKRKSRRPAAPKTEWRRLPEAEQIVSDLVAKHHPHLERAIIACLGKPKATRTNFKINIAKAKKPTDAINAMLRAAGEDELSYVIEIGLDEWAMKSGDERRKILDHELMHFCGLDEESDRWQLVGHDLEVFGEEIRRYGAWRPEITAIARIVKQLDLPGI